MNLSIHLFDQAPQSFLVTGLAFYFEGFCPPKEGGFHRGLRRCPAKQFSEKSDERNLRLGDGAKANDGPKAIGTVGKATYVLGAFLNNSRS